MLEGCPVLRVDEDGASLAELFMVVYHGGRSGFFDWRKPIEFVRLRRITLLALRYKIQHIVDEAIARLEHLFPTTFVPDRLSIHSYVGEKEGYPVTITDAEDAIAVVNLGRAIDSENPPAFIVTALYFCLALSVDDILNGVAFHGETAMLSPADRDLCLRQTDEVLRCNYVVRQPVVDALEKPLCSSKACEAALQSAVCHWIRIKAFTDHLPLEQLSLNLKVPSGAPAGRRICKPCETELLKAMEQQQRKVFEGLGAIFEISSWPTPAET
ncbi:hypothetical protein PsYK624_159920 [Phanerochaete sordida]|uniref:Uncharacterized protein n=1 Tax=Phanerochaete sordida TaxID=48140 RepID=A0A9P3GRY6_9APHY|nr:hypothetical protein PsYK624_159920 [Phanerochaete sordida]